MTTRDLLRAAAARAGCALTNGDPAHGAWAAVSRATGVNRRNLNDAWLGARSLPAHAAGVLRRWLGLTAEPPPPPIDRHRPCPEPARLAEPLRTLCRDWAASPITVCRWRRETGISVPRGRPPSPSPATRRPCPDPSRLRDPTITLVHDWGAAPRTIARWRREAGIELPKGARRERAA